MSQRTIFGTVTVLDPAKVVKLALVVDNWKLPIASKLWAESEKVAEASLKHLNFDPRDIFYSEQMPWTGHEVTNIFRYYTPVANRRMTNRQEK